jgi:hypothetical protein
MSFESAVQQGVYDLLSQDEAIFYSGAPVYDSVPDNAAFPYITIGEDVHNEWDTVNTSGSDATITVHCWSRTRGRKQVKELQGMVYDALHLNKFESESYRNVSIYWESSSSFMDNDARTWHGEQVFRILIERV